MMKSKIIILLAVVFLTYSNTFFNGFIWDDDTLIVHNDRIKNIKNIPSLFVPQQGEPYRPLRYVSFAFDHLFFGTKAGFYHFGNVLLHLINVFLVFRIFLFIFKDEEISFFSALIFGVYPAWNEAVVWIKNRSDLLACFFLLVAFYFFLRQKNILTAVSFILALFAKEISLSFPLIITLYVLLFKKNEIKRTIPFWIISFLWGIFLFVIYKGGGLERYTPGAGLFFSLKVLFKFFLILIFPFSLNAEREVSLPSSVFDFEVISAFLLLFIAGFALLKIRKKEISFAVLWIILNLLPTTNPAVVAGRPLAEHRLYIPGIGFSLLLGLIFQGKRKAVIYALIPVFSIISFKRNFVWKDSYTFWKETTKVAPHSARGMAALGMGELARGNVLKAEEHLRKALVLNPRSDDAINGLIKILIDSGRLDEAEEEALKFLEGRPEVFVVYRGLMDIYILKGKEEKAKEVCKKALGILTDFDIADKGDIAAITPYCWRFGFLEELENLYLKADAKNTADSVIYTNLGTLYYTKGEFEKAITFYGKAIELDPRNSFIHYNLANSYDNAGREEEAIEHFRKAIKYEPKNSSAWYNLGIVFSKIGRQKDAQDCFRKVMELEPGNPEVKKMAARGGMR